MLLLGDGLRDLLLLLSELGHTLGLLFSVELVEACLIGSLGFTTSLHLLDPAVVHVTLALQALGGDKTLDLGCFGGLLDFTADNKLPDVLFLGKVKELADLVGSLGAESAGLHLIGETSNLLLSLLNKDEGHDTEVRADDAASNRLALSLTSSARSIALHSLGEEQSHTVVAEDSLHHRETLLVVSSCDTEDVTFEFLTEAITWDFSGDTLVEEG